MCHYNDGQKTCFYTFSEQIYTILSTPMLFFYGTKIAAKFKIPVTIKFDRFSSHEYLFRGAKNLPEKNQFIERLQKT